MATKHKATFADGQVIKRTSADRVYSHAWRVIYTRAKPEALFDRHITTGFAGSADLAVKAAHSATATTRRTGNYTFTIEVVECERS